MVWWLDAARFERAIELLPRLGRDSRVGPAVDREHRAPEARSLVGRGGQPAAMRSDRPGIEADDAAQVEA